MDDRYLVATLVIFLDMFLIETVGGSQKRLLLDIWIQDMYKKEECILCICFQECHFASFLLSEKDLCRIFQNYDCAQIPTTTAKLQTNKDYCAPHPCFNLGKCTNHPDRYVCQCTAGWTGENCTEASHLNPASQYTTLTVFPPTNVNQFNTVSPQNPIDHCVGHPCFNNGTCSNLHDTFSCQCTAGWTGKDCNTDVDECVLYKPCKNGGTCINTPGYPICQCSHGWSGGQCQIDIDECLTPNACQNGGNCTNAIGSYSCQCNSGFTGALCETDVNECGSNPCRHGGTCNNVPGGFTCQCDAGWTGYECQTEFPKCNHTCALDAVILSKAVGDVNHTCTDGVHFSDDILTKTCCNIIDTGRLGKVQTNNICTDGQIPPYTPIAAFNNTTQVAQSSGIFYGCIKNGQSGFLMIHQNCSTVPQLLTVDGSTGFDPNSFFVIY